jgi:hypothetical protein
MTQNGTTTTSTPTATMPDLGTILLAAESSGQLSADAWPALRSFLLMLADAQASGNLKLVSAQIEQATGPLRTLIQARLAYEQARLALNAGYAAVAQANANPAQIAEAASALAALADDLSGRAQQLAELMQS